MEHRIKASSLLCLAVSTLLLSACVYPISKNLREQAASDVTYSMVHANPSAYAGSIVIWGGSIVEVINNPDQTDIIVLQAPLDHLGMPEEASKSQGRFIARIHKFLDPAIYKKGRKVTVAGQILAAESRPLGNTEYTYPVVEIKQIHLWPEQRAVYMPPAGFYYPYWDPSWGWYMY